jgi:hypothetical protein
MPSPEDRAHGWLLAALLVAIAPGVARANLIAYSGESGAIMPVGDESVEMIDQRLVLHENGKVRAVYTFWNTSGKDVSLLVGFPVLHGPDQGIPVEKLRVTVDGAEVDHRSEKPGCPAAADTCADDLYVFDVTFPPKQNVTITCTYRQEPVRWEGNGTYLSFLLETGRGWKGDIGNFNLYVTIPHPVCSPLEVFGGLFWPMARCTHCSGVDPQDAPSFCQGEKDAAGQCQEGLERIVQRKGTLELWKSRTPFRYTVKTKATKTTLNLWAQDFEPDGNVTVRVPEDAGSCTWDPALVTDALEKACLFSEVVKAKKGKIAQLALEMDAETVRACQGLPDYLLDGGAVFGKETYGGIETAIIEKHHVPGEVNEIPLYMKSGLVPGLKTFEKKLEKILAQLP